jgi:hypothetical protein
MICLIFDPTLRFVLCKKGLVKRLPSIENNVDTRMIGLMMGIHGTHNMTFLGNNKISIWFSVPQKAIDRYKYEWGESNTFRLSQQISVFLKRSCRQFDVLFSSLTRLSFQEACCELMKNTHEAMPYLRFEYLQNITCKKQKNLYVWHANIIAYLYLK